MRRVPTVHRFPVLDQEASALSWRSFSITAAGQPRRFAGFPFTRLAKSQEHQHKHYIWWLEDLVNQYVGFL
jgi:hypothetical protein